MEFVVDNSASDPGGKDTPDTGVAIPLVIIPLGIVVLTAAFAKKKK